MIGTLRFLSPLAALALACIAACGGVAKEGSADSTSGGSGNSGSCVYGGKTYDSGAGFPSLDGCNSCFCDDGSVVCTEKDCGGGCYYQGHYYTVGEGVPSGDCNTCSCGSDGSVSCTQIGCLSCDGVQIAYADALNEAKSCDPTQPNQCTQLIHEGLVCGCSAFANPEKAGAISQLDAFAQQYSAQECFGDVMCGACAEATSGYCSAEGRCEALREGYGAACKVGGVIYASGTSGIQDPASCNLCVCQDGQLACDDQYCPVSCPPDSVFGTQCAECGPTDACLVVEHTCLQVCSEGCANGGACLNGVCRTVCG